MINLEVEYLLPFLLYAEIHYKFKGLYSRLFKSEPEIITDAPFRVEPGHAIPILLLIKDAHRFPIHIIDVTIEVKSSDRLQMKQTFPLNLSIHQERFWYRIFYLDPLKDYSGWVDIDVQIKIKVNGTIKIYKNDNYRISSHDPLKLYLAEEPLPRFDNWYFGDFHYHSNYTEDQVEFGAPLEATVQMARAIGLNFFAVTDHSYDLDNHKDSWVENDHRTPKWYQLWEEVERLNSNLTDFAIIPGEEVSAGNVRNRNVHLLILNHRKFLAGQGDSAERWFRTEPDLSIAQILNQLDEEALAIAGHPEIPTPFLQWLLIRRGQWQWQDFQHHRLDGFQLWNGEQDHSFKNGSATWVKLLLHGRKLFLLAGNDAHGNFNRFRQIGLPFFTFRENGSQLFGNMRTGIKLNKQLNLTQVLQAVKQGNILVSNGPITEFFVLNEEGELAIIGNEVKGNQFKLYLKAKSTIEFGQLNLLCVILGDQVTRVEKTILSFDHFPDRYYFELSQKLSISSEAAYLRIELTTQNKNGEITRCLTNPIWIKNMGRL